MNKLSILLALSLISFQAHAYIGPGMAAGVILAIFGFIAAVLIAIFGVVYYPIKRAVTKKRKKNDSQS